MSHTMTYIYLEEGDEIDVILGSNSDPNDRTAVRIGPRCSILCTNDQALQIARTIQAVVPDQTEVIATETKAA